MKHIIGLTGPTGAGKSSAVGNAKKFGITVIDCDKVVHEIFATDAMCQAALAEAFGEDVIKEGTVDRRVLAQRAFESKESTTLLNDTVFPFVTYRILNDIENAKDNIIILDAPTLFESGIDEICGTTIAVLSDRDTRIKRIIQRDNMSEEAALARISAGKPDEFYLERADHVLYNNGEQSSLEAEFNNLLGRLVVGGK